MFPKSMGVSCHRGEVSERAGGRSAKAGAAVVRFPPTQKAAVSPKETLPPVICGRVLVL